MNTTANIPVETIVRTITGDAVMQIEESISASRETAALVRIMQHAVMDPNDAPTPELASDALGGIARSISEIEENLNDILEKIYSK